MDQNTQQSANNGVNPSTGTEEKKEVIVGGVFGGTVSPTQEAISETMPSFSFDEEEFSDLVEPLATTQQDLLNNPFAGGITSTHMNEVEKHTEKEIIPSDYNEKDIIENSSLPELSVENNAIQEEPLVQNEEKNNSEQTILSNDNPSNLEKSPLSFNLPETNSDINNTEENLEEIQTPLDTAKNMPITLDNLESNNEIAGEESQNNGISQGDTDKQSLSNSDFILPNTEEDVTLSEDVSIPEDITNTSEGENLGNFEVPNNNVADTEHSQHDDSFLIPEIEKSDKELTNTTQEETAEDTTDGIVDIPQEKIESPLSEDTSIEKTLQPEEKELLDFTLSEESISNKEDHIHSNAVIEKENKKNKKGEENKHTEFNQEENLTISDLEEDINTENLITEKDDEVPTLIGDDNNKREVWKDTSHELSESYEEFNTTLSSYLNFLESDKVSIVGLRTQEEEIHYIFEQENDKNTSIEKSNTSDIIDFSSTESGLQVLLNKELIAYYGVDKVANDTTHYLKEKLGKFTMMISSEHEKEQKKQKEQTKRIKNTLKNF